MSMRPIIPASVSLSSKTHAYCVDCDWSTTQTGAKGADDVHELAAMHLYAEGHLVCVDSYHITREKFGGMEQ